MARAPAAFAKRRVRSCAASPTGMTVKAFRARLRDEAAILVGLDDDDAAPEPTQGLSHAEADDAEPTARPHDRANGSAPDLLERM